MASQDYAKQLENSIRMGYPCLLENVGEDLDPMLEPLLLRQTFVNGNTVMIKLGENNVPWDDKFRCGHQSQMSIPMLCTFPQRIGVLGTNPLKLGIRGFQW
jgi:hypothetical protein